MNMEVDLIAKYVERLMAGETATDGREDEDDETRTERSRRTSLFATIPEAIEDIREGRMVIVVDDADRENEGDLIMAAEKVTPEAIAFIVRHTSGVICMPVTGERLDELRDPADGGGQHRSSANGVHRLGRRAPRRDDRDLGRRSRRPRSARSPTRHRARGPVAARAHLPASLPGGRRAQARRPHRGVGRSRAARRALYPAGVLCETVNEDGTMARLPDLARFASEHGLKIISIADLIEYRREHGSAGAEGRRGPIPTANGEFGSYAYESASTDAPMSRWCSATSATAPTCSRACTRSA